MMKTPLLVHVMASLVVAAIVFPAGALAAPDDERAATAPDQERVERALMEMHKRAIMLKKQGKEEAAKELWDRITKVKALRKRAAGAAKACPDCEDKGCTACKKDGGGCPGCAKAGGTCPKCTAAKNRPEDGDGRRRAERDRRHHARGHDGDRARGHHRGEMLRRLGAARERMRGARGHDHRGHRPGADWHHGRGAHRDIGRAGHLRMALMHLRAAGLGEVAERLERHLKQHHGRGSGGQPPHRGGPRGERAGGPSHTDARLGHAVRELRGEVEQLKRQLERLRADIGRGHGGHPGGEKREAGAKKKAAAEKKEKAEKRETEGKRGKRGGGRRGGKGEPTVIFV